MGLVKFVHMSFENIEMVMCQYIISEINNIHDGFGNI